MSTTSPATRTAADWPVPTKISPRFPLASSGEYNPPPSVPHMDGKRAAPRKGRRVVFVGDGVSTSRQRGGAALPRC